MIVAVSKRISFNNICHMVVVNLQSSDATVMSYTHSTVTIVLDHTHLPGAAGAMTIGVISIVVVRSWVTIIVDKIPASFGILAKKIEQTMDDVKLNYFGGFE